VVFELQLIFKEEKKNYNSEIMDDAKNARKYVKDFQPMVKVPHKVFLRLQQSKHLLFAKQKWQG
jgi:hypothetical protein